LSDLSYYAGVGVIVFLLIFFIFYPNFQNYLFKKRKNFIKNYTFPKRLKSTLIKKHPHLSDDDVNLVLEQLKNYFIISLQAKGKMVAMPSVVVDDAWHEFLLFTKEYQDFSKKAFGRFFHHHPDEAIGSNNKMYYSLIVAWELACILEGLSPKYTNFLPMLFKIDSLLNIKDGNFYTKEDIKNIQKNLKEFGSDDSIGGCGGSIACAGCTSGHSCGGGCGGS